MKSDHRWMLWGALLLLFAFLIFAGVKSGDPIMTQMESSTL